MASVAFGFDCVGRVGDAGRSPVLTDSAVAWPAPTVALALAVPLPCCANASGDARAAVSASAMRLRLRACMIRVSLDDESSPLHAGPGEVAAARLYDHL